MIKTVGLAVVVPLHSITIPLNQSLNVEHKIRFSQVNVEDNDLVITGEHKDSGDQQSVHRTFMRRIKLPETIHKETIECNLDEKGRLEVTANHKDTPKVTRQSIPIGFKQSTSQAIDSGNKSNAEEKKK